MIENVTILDIPVEIEKKAIKNMHLAVYPPNARVHLSMPEYLDISDAERFFLSKLDWVRRSIKEIKEQPRQSEREYVSGENYYLFGIRYRLILKEICSGTAGIVQSGETLMMTVKKGATIERKNSLMMEWYRGKLKEYLEHVVPKWTEKFEEKNVTWQVKQMKTMWGSCNVKKRNILFNLELARVPQECIEYIIVHELTHLKVDSHNALFAALMSNRMPNWKAFRDQINAFIALPIKEIEDGKRV